MPVLLATPANCADPEPQAHLPDTWMAASGLQCRYHRRGIGRAYRPPTVTVIEHRKQDEHHSARHCGLQHYCADLHCSHRLMISHLSHRSI